MPRSRPAALPISYHRWTRQYYVTRGGKRLYLGTDRRSAIDQYHRLALGSPLPDPHVVREPISCKELANRFLAAQRANWRNPEVTGRGYRDWLRQFLVDHPGLRAGDFTVEKFAAWKLLLRRRKYAVRTINHLLGAVRAVFKFGEDTDLIEKAPRLNRIRNERQSPEQRKAKELYTPPQIQQLLQNSEPQLRTMIYLAINAGLGPKDVEDLQWDHIDAERLTLARSKTGVSQTFVLWPETRSALDAVRNERQEQIVRAAKRGHTRIDGGRVFMTKYWRTWNKDAVSEQFRKLCKAAGVPCHGFYRLRHCASTAMALVAMPHVHRKFMRHLELQQQVTYTHTPDAEVDTAVLRARSLLLPMVSIVPETNPAPANVLGHASEDFAESSGIGS